MQELTVPAFVPNDTLLLGGPGKLVPSQGIVPSQCSEESNDNMVGIAQKTRNPKASEGPSMLMLTGPNYSGKSVYLKQIALIVYMAHVGSYVPADQAIIGLTDKILTRIATRETVSKFQSSFMIDLQQAALAMSLATHKSLVIIDEFGKGTESSGKFIHHGTLEQEISELDVDGAGLACGVFEHFLGLGDDRPKVLGATHFHEIFENGFLAPRKSLSFGYMEVRLDQNANKVDDQITYLYK